MPSTKNLLEFETPSGNSSSRLAFAFGAFAAITGGVLRIGTSFLSGTDTSASMEMLYGLIDLCLLFGLLAFYGQNSRSLGKMGLLGFIVATGGIASIVGPDPVIYNLSFYQLGATVFALGLTGLSIAMMREKIASLAALFWLITLLLGLLSSVTANQRLFQLCGAALGIGYVLVGREVLNRLSNDFSKQR